MEAKTTEAVFLDRDGTINEEVGYLDRMDKLRLIRGAAEGIRWINESGMKAVVITNQSGVARGYYDEAFVGRLHALLREMLSREGAFLDGIYFCPHHPTAGLGGYLRICDCRKPAPGMILRAAVDLGIDLARSWLIGDTLNDIEAGTRAGVRAVLVRTGLGEVEFQKLRDTAPWGNPYGRAAEAEGNMSAAGPKRDPRQPEFIAADLREAVVRIIQDRRQAVR